MPRKYDRTIRYYDSWFADLLDEEKAFTAEECWQVMLAIRECQLDGSLEPLNNLPLSIRRALSMATMGEQIIRQLERSENMRKRGSAGGRAAAAKQRTPEEIAAAQMRAQREQQEQQQRDQNYEQQKAAACSPKRLKMLILDGCSGNEDALKELRLTKDQCIQFAKRQKLID